MSMTVTQLTQGNLRLSYQPPGQRRLPARGVEESHRQEACKCAFGHPAGNQASLERLAHEYPFSGCSGDLPSCDPDVLSGKSSSPRSRTRWCLLPLPDNCGACRRQSRQQFASESPLPAPPPTVEEPPPPPQRVAKLIAPQPLVAPKPKPVEVPNVKPAEVPRINQALTEAKFEAPPEPARPREPVKVDNLSTGSAAPATVNKPIDQVQTGGFGDPHGLPGPSNPNRAANVGHFGSPALPPGPGYGNGTGGANGVRGTVASTGFGNGVAGVAPAASGGPARNVRVGRIRDGSRRCRSTQA